MTIRLSPSSSETFNDCPRKWFFHYVLKAEEPAKPGAEAGTALHDLAERWLKTRDTNLSLDPAWRFFSPGLKFLEPLDYNVETWLEGTCGPLAAVGKVDFWNIAPERLLIGDWKTTGRSDFAYAKSPKKLAAMTQPLFYAKLIGDANGRPPTLQFQHINLGTSKVMVKNVQTGPVSWDAVDERWGELETQAQMMSEYAETTLEEVPADTRSCRRYGGCPFSDRCPSSPIYVPVGGDKEEDLPPSMSMLNALDDILRSGAPPQLIGAPEAPPQRDAKQLVIDALRPILDEGMTLSDTLLLAQCAAHGADPAEVRAALTGLDEPTAPDEPAASEAPQQSTETAQYLSVLRKLVTENPSASAVELKALFKTAIGRQRFSADEFNELLVEARPVPKAPPVAEPASQPPRREEPAASVPVPPPSRTPPVYPRPRPGSSDLFEVSNAAVFALGELSKVKPTLSCLAGPLGERMVALLIEAEVALVKLGSLERLSRRFNLALGPDELSDNDAALLLEGL